MFKIVMNKINNKKEILSLVAVTFVIAIVAGIGSFVSAWSEPGSGCNPPSCDTVSPIDVKNISNNKSGRIFIQDNTATGGVEEGQVSADRIYTWEDGSVIKGDTLIGVAGITGVTPNLFVKKDLVFDPYNEYNSPGVFPKNLCINSTGEIVTCDAIPEGEDPFYSYSRDITIVHPTSALTSDDRTAYCPATHPYVIGGGGECYPDGLFDEKGIKRLEPIKSGAAYYNAFKIECRATTSEIEVYAICSK